MWAAWLAETVTGNIGPKINLLSGSCDITLNSIESWSLTTPWTSFRELPTKWRDPYRTSIVIGHACDLLPDWWAVVSGPMTDHPTLAKSPDRAGRAIMTMKGAGMRHMATKRHYTGGMDYQGDVDAVKAAAGRFKGMSLGTIQSLLVEHMVQRKGGQLPLNFVMHLRETGLSDTTGHERTYEGFNVANDDIDKLLTDLSEVQGGPDFMMRPRFTDAGSRILHDVVHGTTTSVNIPQGKQLVWDATATRGPVTGFEVVADSTAVTNRVWATGAGEGTGIAMAVAENEKMLAAGFPLLESVHSSQSTTEIATLKAHAQGQLDAGASPTVQTNLVIRGDHAASTIGTWHVGDIVTVITPDHPVLPAGEHQMTIISASMNMASESVTVHLQ